jgi:hypothetical protein
MKVAICIPSTDDWRADFAMSVAGLVAYAAKTPAPNGEPIDIRIFNMRFAYVTFSRNCMFREALAWKADWILHVETDLYFPKDALHQLLVHDKDCVSLNVVQRRARKPDVINAALRQGKQIPGMNMLHGVHMGDQYKALVKVDFTSFSFMLIRAAALRKIPPPWAAFEGDLDLLAPGDCEVTIRQCEKSAYNPDDGVFCKKLREHGSEVFSDTKLSRQVRHVGIARFGFNGPEVAGTMFDA